MEDPLIGDQMVAAVGLTDAKIKALKGPATGQAEHADSFISQASPEDLSAVARAFPGTPSEQQLEQRVFSKA